MRLDIMLGLIAIIALPVLLTLGFARWRRMKDGVLVFLMATLMLPALSLLCGLASMFYFSRIDPDAADGGEGAAFLLFIMFGSSALLIIPGLVSGCVAYVFFRRSRLMSEGN